MIEMNAEIIAKSNMIFGLMDNDAFYQLFVVIPKIPWDKRMRE